MDGDVEIWSGGQTGVDRAALDCALELGLPHRGWIPRGRRAEDGPISERYTGLREAPTDQHDERTKLNVRDTDATLVLRWGEASGGTRLAMDTACSLNRTILDVDLAAMDVSEAAQLIAESLGRLRRPLRLNVAGPRASEAPAVYARARAVLNLVLR
jgi:hypothetical protein